MQSIFESARGRVRPETHLWSNGLEFEVHPILAAPSGPGGVYVMAQRGTGLLEPTWRAWYIGKADSFSDRVCMSHHRLLDAIAQGASHLHVYRLAEPLRGIMEEQLIAQYRPPLNDQHNPMGLLDRAMLGLR